jgi:beta-ureidopropionase / N-carbamoyl-L-amino-acid hydrolase
MPHHECQVQFSRSMAMPTTWFSDGAKTAVREAAVSRNLSSIHMLSGAFDDSIRMAKHCPTGTLCVPSRAGLSHNPQESTDPNDLIAGTRALGLPLGITLLVSSDPSASRA